MRLYYYWHDFGLHDKKTIYDARLIICANGLPLSSLNDF